VYTGLGFPLSLSFEEESRGVATKSTSKRLNDKAKVLCMPNVKQPLLSEFRTNTTYSFDLVTRTTPESGPFTIPVHDEYSNI